MSQENLHEPTRQSAKMPDALPTRVALFGIESARLDILCLQLRRIKISPLHLRKTANMSQSWHSSFQLFAQCCLVDQQLIYRQDHFMKWYLFLRGQHPSVPMILFECGYDGDFTEIPSNSFDAVLPMDYTLSDLEFAFNEAFDQNCVTRLTAALSDR